ncbi:uncharacterized protein [Amphiura filiformis]|uniref:uncharacterized protein isoform X2 n=1 Tax=Amphiura filiformis TaxID=82378 RepID=UPI003B21DD7B
MEIRVAIILIATIFIDLPDLVICNHRVAVSLELEPSDDVPAGTTVLLTCNIRYPFDNSTDSLIISGPNDDELVNLSPEDHTCVPPDPFECVGWTNSDVAYSLRIPNITISEGGEYRCNFTQEGSEGLSGNTHTVSKDELKSIYIQPTGEPSCMCNACNSDLLQYDGDIIDLNCTLDDGFPGVSLAWTITSNSVLPSSLDEKSMSIVSSLTQVILNSSHNGTYFTCSATQEGQYPGKSCSIGPFLVFTLTSSMPTTTMSTYRTTMSAYRTTMSSNMSKSGGFGGGGITAFIVGIIIITAVIIIAMIIFLIRRGKCTSPITLLRSPPTKESHSIEAQHDVKAIGSKDAEPVAEVKFHNNPALVKHVEPVAEVKFHDNPVPVQHVKVPNSVGLGVAVNDNKKRYDTTSPGPKVYPEPPSYPTLPMTRKYQKEHDDGDNEAQYVNTAEMTQLHDAASTGVYANTLAF